MTKPLVLALFVFVMTVSTATITNAQPTPAEIQNNYGSYINLFQGSTLGYNKNGDKGGPIIGKNSTVVEGFHFILGLRFGNNSEEALEKNWAHVLSTNSSVSQDAFILTNCLADGGGDCAYARIPYLEKPDASTWTKIKSFGYSWYTIPSAIPRGIYRLFGGTDAVYEFGKSIENEASAQIKQKIQDSVILFQKAAGANDAYLIPSEQNGKRELNILATDWFTIDASGTVKDYNRENWVKTKSRTVTLWYCGVQTSDTQPHPRQAAEDAVKAGVTGITHFGTLCGGTPSFGSYFRVATVPYSVVPPLSLQEGIDQNKKIEGADPTKTTEAGSNLPTCGLLPTEPGTVVGCLAQLVYYGLYIPIAWIAGLFGNLFDFFIGYSVSDESYRYAFAVTGWKLVRDIANIMFIIILIYTGFAAVFSFGGTGGSTLKRVVPFLIINALIINFSLFATRTVIDISNITARVFYSRMIVCDGPCVYEGGSNIPKNVKRGLGGHWPLSEKIVDAFDPQKMFRASVLESKEQPTTSTGDRLNPTGAAGVVDQYKGFAKNSAEYAGYYALVSLLAAGIMLFVGIMFFKVMFMFLGRVIGLYVAMIFSPFAFITLNGGGGFFSVKGYEWSTWSKDLFNYAALAPIFTFFLYIIYSFINTDMVAQIGLKDTTGGFFGTLLTIAVPMLIIYKLIDYGGKMAAKYAGEFGMMAQNTLSKVAGMAGGAALGLASGGLAMAGTGIVARGAKALGNTEWGKRQALNADTSRTARFFNNTLSKTQTGSWDFRNTKLSGLVNKGVTQVTGGVKLDDRVTGRLGLSTSNFAGGAVAQRKREEDKIKESFNKKLEFAHLSDDDAKKLWEKKHAKDIENGVEKESDRLVHENLSKNDSGYQKAAADAATEKARLTTLQERQERAIADIEARLKAPGISDTARTASTASLNNLRSNLNTTTQSLKTVDKKKDDMVEDVKSNTGRFEAIKNTDEYKKGVEKKRTELEKEVTDKYGKINNVKDYANAMRDKYVEDKQNNSLWMKDGKQRAGLSAIPLGGAGAAALAGLSVSVAGIAGAVISDAIKSRQEAFEAAAKSYRKDYGKKKGKGSKLEQNVKDLDATKESIEEIIGGKLDDIPFEQQKTKVREEILRRQSEYDMASIEYDRLAKDWKQGDPEGPLKVASKRRREAQDNLKHAENIWKKKEDLEKNIDTEEEKEKKKAEEGK